MDKVPDNAAETNTAEAEANTAEANTAEANTTEANTTEADLEAFDAEDAKILDLDLEELTQVEAIPSPASSTWGNRSVSGEARQSASESPSANVVDGDEATIRNTTDAGNLLGKSTTNPGVYIQQRSPIISDPRFAVIDSASIWLKLMVLRGLRLAWISIRY